MKGKMIAALNNISMRKKLFISYFLLITLPISGFVIFNDYKNSQATKQQILISLERTTQEAGLFLDYRTNRLLDIINAVSMDEQLQKVLQQETYSTSDDIPAHMSAYSQLSLHVSNLEGSFNVDKIKIYVHENVLFSGENDHFFKIDSKSPPPWYSRVQAQYQAVWLPPQVINPDSDRKLVVSIAKPIIDMSNYNNTIGVLMLDMSIADLDMIMNKVIVTPATFVMLLNSHGEVISHIGTTPAETTDSMARVVTDAVPTNLQTSPNRYHQMTDKHYFIEMKGIEGSDWTLAAVTPRSDIEPSFSYFILSTLFLIAVIAVSAYLLSHFISQSMTKRISMLISQMRRVESGNLDVKLPPSSQDEIGLLSKNFMYMLTNMKVMLDEQLKVGKELKSAELKALQAQINPHFLYNTLELINWKATEKNAHEISSIVQSLSKFFKLSLGRGKDMVTLENEIEHVRTYVSLQNMRFRNSIQLIVTVPKELLSYPIPKIILQPIVENSILHGIRNREEEAGHIHITGEVSADTIVLRLEDNGVGMSNERLREIMSDSYEGIGSGYGVKNIHDRLRMLFGERFGLTFQSEVGQGTIVMITLPANV